VLTTSLGIFGVWLLGAVAVAAWSLARVLAGTANGENTALVVLLPLAWILGFWVVAGPLLAVWKIRQLQSVLDEHCRRKAAGLDAGTTEQDVEDALTQLATRESSIPERWARRLVRLMLARTPPPEAEAGAS